jgi:site-specific DNA recombinase
MKVAALYARVSSERQAQQATIDSQLAALKERAAVDQRVVLAHDVFADDGFSGSTLVRPALERLRDRIAEGGVEMLYVHSPDRLARKYAYQVLLLEEFRKAGVTTVFLNGRNGETPEDELLIQVQGMIAEYERTKIVERCRRGRIHHARQGSVGVMSQAPYGYLYVKRRDEAPASYQVLLHEAKIVRRIFHELVHEQRSMGRIARELNAERVPTRHADAGSMWHPSTVRAIVRNSTYIGEAAYGKTESVEANKVLRPRKARRDQRAAPRQVKTGHRDKPREQWITIAAPPLVTRDVFDAAQEQLARNKRLAQRNRKEGRYLLAGLTVCARCGYAFCGSTTRRFGYYSCSGCLSGRYPGGRVCDMRPVRVDQLDGYVWESVTALLLSPKRMLDEWTRRQADGVPGEIQARRDDAVRSLSAHERNLKRLVDAYEAGAIELRELKTRSDAVRVRIKHAQKEVDDAEHALHETIDMRAIVTRLEDFAMRVQNGIDALSWNDQREIVRALIARVEISDEGATVVYRVPAAPAPKSGNSGTAGGEGSPASGGNNSYGLRTASQPSLRGCATGAGGLPHAIDRTHKVRALRTLAGYSIALAIRTALRTGNARGGHVA